MKTFHVKIICKTLETYAIKAESLEEVEDYWFEGKLINTDDNIENEILSIEEA